MERPDGIAELFSAAANPARVRMMALLIGGERGLDELMTTAGLSKNAAVNHLTKLMGMGMVRRVSRGRYALTQDGRALILTGTRLFIDTDRRGETERERLRHLYIQGRGDGLDVERRTVQNKGNYLCCWISFNGAVGGALRAQGVDCDVVDVAGRSGYAFLLNVPKGRMCPSAPTSFESSVYEEFVKGVGELGIGAELWTQEGGYEGGADASPSDRERAMHLFHRVKGEIDRSGRPLVLWGLPIPEFGIVNGYEGQSYVASTFRSMGAPDKEELVAATDIHAPACLMTVTFGGPRPVGGSWLERAVTMASGRAQVCKGFVSGPKAAHEWSLSLLRAEDAEYMGNSYTAACWSEGRSNAGAFLKRMAREHKGRLAREMREAADSYAKGAQVMEEYVRLFPFNFQGHFEEKTLERGASLLMELKEHEENAFLRMKEALACWH